MEFYLPQRDKIGSIIGRVHNSIHDWDGTIPRTIPRTILLSPSGKVFYIDGLVTAGFMLASFRLIETQRNVDCSLMRKYFRRPTSCKATVNEIHVSELSYN